MLREENLYLFCVFVCIIYFGLLDLTLRRECKNYRKPEKPTIFAVWHGIQNGIGFFPREDRAKINILISKSNDGEIANRICRFINFQTIRGSHKRDGAKALRDIIRALKRGESIMYTVDGPRGPKHEVKGGIIKIAQMSGAVVVPITIEIRPAIKAKSWDDYELPLPFGSFFAVMGDEIQIPAKLSEEEHEKYRKQIEDELFKLKEIAIKETNGNIFL
jgi:lysophospholipid acyltransferase (LPLAT)-like uncharacterized protein